MCVCFECFSLPKSLFESSFTNEERKLCSSPNKKVNSFDFYEYKTKKAQKKNEKGLNIYFHISCFIIASTKPHISSFLFCSSSFFIKLFLCLVSVCSLSVYFFVFFFSLSFWFPFLSIIIIIIKCSQISFSTIL